MPRSAPPSSAGVVIDVDPATRYQEIAGFGAAITDASAELIQNRLAAPQRAALMQELFGRDGNGIGLSFTRLTIGASDFSSQHYSFDDMPKGQTDPDLKHFSIEPNRETVLPTVKAALAINPQLKVMASPWSAPALDEIERPPVPGHPEAGSVRAVCPVPEPLRLRLQGRGRDRSSR